MASTAPDWPFPKLPDARVLLSGEVCFDTMILSWLARARKWEMVQRAFGDRARMPDRVRGELVGWSRSHDEIANLMPPKFGQSISLDRAGAQRASDRQRAWLGKETIQADPRRDRGEAECLELCQQHHWPLVSHDGRARGDGRRQGTPVLTIVDVLMVLVARGEMLAASAWKTYVGLVGDDKEDQMLECGDWPCSEESEETFMACCEAMLLASKGQGS